MNPAQVLREAAKLVRKGWCQGDHARVDGSKCYISSPNANQFCAEGAIIRVTDSYSAWRFVDHLQRFIGFDNNVAAWNDTPGRTAEEVALALEQAAVLAEGETK